MNRMTVFTDLETLDKRKLRKIIEKNNKIFYKQVSKNDKINNKKTKNKQNRKKEKLSIEWRKKNEGENTNIK